MRRTFRFLAIALVFSFNTSVASSATISVDFAGAIGSLDVSGTATYQSDRPGTTAPDPNILDYAIDSFVVTIGGSTSIAHTATLRIINDDTTFVGGQFGRRDVVQLAGGFSNFFVGGEDVNLFSIQFFAFEPSGFPEILTSLELLTEQGQFDKFSTSDNTVNGRRMLYRVGLNSRSGRLDEFDVRGSTTSIPAPVALPPMLLCLVILFYSGARNGSRARLTS